MCEFKFRSPIDALHESRHQWPFRFSQIVGCGAIQCLFSQIRLPGIEPLVQIHHESHFVSEPHPLARFHSVYDTAQTKPTTFV
jgi:hypothetical protein